MKSIKKINQKIKTLCAVASMVAFIGQPLFALAADPATSADVVVKPNQNSPQQNAASNKQKLPTLQVIFDKAAAKSGDTITATAASVGFAYDDDSLYYTWYLKHKNGSDDPEDWKIEAAKREVRGNFDKESANYSKQIFDNVDKGYLALPGWELDKDDYSGAAKAMVEDADSQNCYLQDYSTGKIWEISSSDTSFNCPSNSRARCVQSQQFDIPPSECTQDLGGGTTTPKDACVMSAQEEPSCSTSDYANYSTAISCPTGTTPMCIQEDATIFPSTVTNADVCDAFNFLKGNATGFNCTNAAVSTSPVGPDGTTPSDGLRCTRARKSNSCKHLFPDIGVGKVGDGKYTLAEERAWGTNPSVKSTAGNDGNDEMNLVGLQKSSFTWTYQEGDQIGVAVEGMAQQGTQHNDSSKMISWAFSKNSCPAFSEKISDTPDSKKEFYTSADGNAEAGILSVDSFDLNDCLEDNLIDPAVSGIGNLDVSLMYEPQNPINAEPETAGPNQGLSKGDVVTVTSNVNNVEDASNFYYSWSIEGRKNNSGMGDIDDSGWTDITSRFNDHTPLEGIGTSKFSFKLNLSADKLMDTDDPKYIRVKLRVFEGANSASESRAGMAEAVIKVTNQKTDIMAYGVKIENGTPVVDKSLVVCGQNEEPCIVAKNEIVAAMLPNNDSKNIFTQFGWKYNKDALPCDTAKVPECKDNMVLFPVVGEEGSSVNISVSAKAGNTGQVQEFNKTFAIVKPSVQITPADNNSSFKALGLKTDLDGNAIPIYSYNIIQTIANSDVTLKASFHPGFISKSTQYTWTIDGQQEDSKADNTITFHSGDQGSVNNVDVFGSYAQPIEVRKALQSIWGVSALDSTESAIQNSVQVEIPVGEEGNPGELDSDTPMGAMGSPTKFFASLLTDLPSQAMFFMRICLTAVLLLLTTGVLFSVIPGAVERERSEI